jgi:hypothetical protein
VCCGDNALRGTWRIARLTLEVTKTFEKLKTLVLLHDAPDNFVVDHGMLRLAAAVAAGFDKALWTGENLVEAA